MTVFSECLSIKVPNIAGILFVIGFIFLLIVAAANLYKSGD